MTDRLMSCKLIAANFLLKADLFIIGPLLLTEMVGEDQAFSSPFGCCTQDVLLCCHPILSEEHIAARLSLVQRLETTLHNLSTATDGAGQQSNQGLFSDVSKNISKHVGLCCALV